MSLEHVKAFYEKLASDEVFRTQVESAGSKEECSQIVKAAGFDFTLEEYEEYTIQLLESAVGEGEIKDLDAKELATVFGGSATVQPLYGIIRNPNPVPHPVPHPIPHPILHIPYPIQPQPLYGIVVVLPNQS